MKNKFFSLGRLPPWRPPTVEKCTFLPRAEKEQDNYAEGIIIFKRVAPERANLRFAPSGLPHSRDGLVVAGVTLIARTVPASRLSVTHALSPLGLAERVLKAFVLNL